MVPSPFFIRRHGVALVVVLTCVALLTAIIVAFLIGVGSEVQSAKFYANGSSSRLLAQTATDLVMAEIRDATADGSLCWASQPGMIRTYDNAGALKKYYKLYSDDAMVTATFDHTVTLIPDGNTAVNGSNVAWYNQKGVYVDLNEPILVNGGYQYPILYGQTKELTLATGGSAGTANGDLNDLTFSTSNTTTPLPQIILPKSLNTVKILQSGLVASGATIGLPSGFWMNRNTPVNPNLTNLSQPIQGAPMPVKWLYVLQDGSLAVPDTDTTATSTVSFTKSTSSPTAANPIVGRVAFWTDDETCKVNINTAAEGSYWDVPRGNTPNGMPTAANGATEELLFGRNAPAQYEFQRYPGHPATTSLSAVLYATDPNGLYLLSPRYGIGGSLAGTYLTTEKTTPVSSGPVSGTSYLAVAPNANRLYASVDEYLYQPTGPSAAPPRALNPAATFSALPSSPPTSPIVTQTFLKQERFFLTANNRAPDVNLFNRPRVCIWPISATNNSTYRSVYDQLIAFCSTMRTDLPSPYLYYFQRQDATDPNVDLPAAGSVAGLGRNRMLLEYMRRATGGQLIAGGGGNIPGFGGSFYDKYKIMSSTGTARDCDQILTEIFDYIRATNTVEPGVTAYTLPLNSSFAGRGQVIPITDTTNGTHGFGRSRTVQGATLLFIANADGDLPPTQLATGGPSAGFRRLQAVLLLQLFDPSVGSAWDYVNLNVSATSSGPGMSACGIPASVSVHTIASNLDNDCSYGDQLGFARLLADNPTGFIGTPFDVPNASPFAFAGGTITVQLQTPATGSTHPMTTFQTVTLNFPAATIPLPTFAPSGVDDYNYAGTYQGGPYNLRFFSTPPPMLTPNKPASNEYPTGATTIPQGSLGRMGSVNTGNPTSFNSATFFTYNTGTYAWSDVARSVAVPADPRLVAAQSNPDPSLFSVVGDYYNYNTVTTPNQVAGMHSQYNGIGDPYYGAVAGKLVQGENYDSPSVTTTGTPAGINYNNGIIYPGGNPTGSPAVPIPSPPGGNGGPSSPYNFADVFNPAATAKGAPLNGVTMGSTLPFGSSSTAVLGDWDNGIGSVRDGPYINKADEGDQGNVDGSGKHFYAYNWKERVGTYNLSTSLYTPNREVPSAVTFGSLPTEVFANKPWQTLLFRPGPNNHRGLGSSVSAPGTDAGPPYLTPPDHLFLDLFTMPVVEPYAISEPLSTAGRVNMNSLIVPFNYINRDTGLRAVLKNEKVISIADRQANYYKQIDGGTASTVLYGMRYPVNIDATLSQFYTRRFNKNDIFRSPSEICDIDIVPSQNAAGSDPNSLSSASLTNGVSRATMDAYWNTSSTPSLTIPPLTGHRLTGDNSRERIYSTLYPRLTTKSNTFTIHFRAQSLKQAVAPGSPATAWQTWREGTDVVAGEYRGSQTIERYVDPNDPLIPDFTDPNNSAATLAPYYRFRVLATKQFSP